MLYAKYFIKTCNFFNPYDFSKEIHPKIKDVSNITGAYNIKEAIYIQRASVANRAKDLFIHHNSFKQFFWRLELLRRSLEPLEKLEALLEIY